MYTTEEEADFIFNHVFLPPKLPLVSDEDKHAHILLQHVVDTALDFTQNLEHSQRVYWHTVEESVKRWQKAFDTHGFDVDSAKSSIKNMPPGQTLLLNIKCQNAAILIRRDRTTMTFDTFEVSPTTNAVLETSGNLIRVFPARSIVIDHEKVKDEKFLGTIMEQLHNLAGEQTSMSLETITKANMKVQEVRQTEHPRLVTQWFFAILAAKGRPVSQHTTITKRTRDDVSWADTLKPWRRSPMWLCIKVGLQLMLEHTYGTQANSIYKIFMMKLICHMTTTVTQFSPPLEHLHIIREKLASRSSKLPPTTPVHTRKFFLRTIEKIRTIMDAQWAEATAHETNQSSCLLNMGGIADDLELKHSKGHLNEVWNQFRTRTTVEQAHPDIPPAFMYTFNEDELPTLLATSETEGKNLKVLFAFNEWIRNHLKEWARNQMPNGETCVALKELIGQYFILSRSTFSQDPELMSESILVLLELWLVLDQMAISKVPLLEDFPVEIPSDIFKPLRLARGESLVRLAHIEAYLAQRHAKSIPNNPSIFSNPGPRSFGVQAFQKSRELQELQQIIQEDSKQDKEKLLEVYKQQKVLYETIIKAAQAIPRCDKEWGDHGWRHAYNCVKCRFVRNARRLKVSKYEEPLPDNEWQAQTVVFELQPPEQFIAWRDATQMLLQDVLSSSFDSGVAVKATLANYQQLSRYYKQVDRRVELGSRYKPFSNSHYIYADIQTTVESELFVRHGLEHKYHDNAHKDLWLANRTSDQQNLYSVSRFCRAKLPIGPYTALLESLHSHTHSQNGIMARQSACPISLSTHEFVAFGTMRAGSHLQLLNLLRSLISHDIELNSASVVTLFEQILHEVGSASGDFQDILRVSHQEMGNLMFCRTMLRAIETHIANIETNWKEVNSMKCCLITLQRLLTLTDFSGYEFRNEVVASIRNIRRISLGWALTFARQYFDIHHEDLDIKSAKEMQKRVIEAAWLTRATWSTDAKWRSHLLSSDADLADYVATSILICDYKKMYSAHKDQTMRRSLLVDQVTALENETIIRELALKSGIGVSQGVQKCWSAIDTCSSWDVLHGANDQWISSTSADTEQHACFNIITGELLIAGRPVSVLPSQYTCSPIYKQVFGERVVNVISSDRLWMDFMTTGNINGSRVYFGVSNQKHIIQLKQGDVTAQAILRTTFKNDLPKTIIDRTQPWAVFEQPRGFVELRDNALQFEKQDYCWRIAPSASSAGRYATTRGANRLVDTSTAVGAKVCRVFENFEETQYLEISFNDDVEEKDQIVKVELPRYRLTFHLNKDTGRFRCLELAAEIDGDQFIGTFYGLKSRLVLSSINSSPRDKKRLILVPYGEVVVNPNGYHHNIKIDVKDHSSLRFFQYKISNGLCKIDADGDLESHLFKAYLHALTSSCLPDTLTDRTGIEEALDTLQDTVVLSSVPLSKTAVDILKCISRLTPIRKYYPDANTRTVQHCRWNDDLPSLSQHDGFSDIAINISTHSILANFLYEGDKSIVPDHAGNKHLTDRALRRTSRYLQANQLEATDQGTAADAKYKSRDCDHDANELATYQIAASIFAWTVAGPVESDLYTMMEKHKSTIDFREAFMPTRASDLLELDMKVYFPVLLSYACNADYANANVLATQLSLIAFGAPDMTPLVNTLIAFATMPSLSSRGLPPALEYDLTCGRTYNAGEVDLILDECQCAQPHDLEQIYGEHLDEDDIEEQFLADVQYQRGLVQHLVRMKWKTGIINLPRDEISQNFDCDALQEMLVDRVTIWSTNHVLYQKCLGYSSELKNVANRHHGNPLPSFDVKHGEKQSEIPKGIRPSLLKILSDSTPSDWGFRPPKRTFHDGSIQSIHASRTSTETDTSARSTLEFILDRVDKSLEDGAGEEASILRSSLNAFDSRQKNVAGGVWSPEHAVLVGEFEMSRKAIQEYLQAVHQILPKNESEEGFRAAGLWPRANIRSLLKLLTSKFIRRLPEFVRDTIFTFAREITTRQRLSRMLQFEHVADKFAMQREVENDAHTAWDIHEHPDWLLLEIQNDFLIRPIQVTVAEEIVKPESTILQLGMGEGKTSVILPMAILALKGTTRLTRVVVLKSLATEMLRSLSRSLSGLVGTPVFHLPFSRSTVVDQQNLGMLAVIRDDCKARGGVLLALPEHLNSFRLMGNDKAVANQVHVMQRLLGTQKGLDGTAIDILDECDEILHPRNELVYSMGTSRTLSGAPWRWQTLLDLLDLAAINADTVSRSKPHSIEYLPTSTWSYPRIRLLRDDAYQLLSELMLQDIRNGALAKLPLHFYDSETADRVIHFIRELEETPGTITVIRQAVRKQEELQQIYLLRGMFAYGTLKSALESRWFVQYGLDRSRSLAAVPYRAKSTPASAAEFAQADVMIILTSLSYFYTGLEFEDLRYCFTLLLKCPNPSEEYLKWIKISSIPHQYRNINAINAESDICVEQLYPLFKMNKAVINFFLRCAVFPKEAKEFPQKLCSNAWDLCAGGPNRFVSGFSGTCDVLMPLTVSKKDIRELRHYDAAVLIDILNTRNWRYVYAGDFNGQALDTSELLQLVSHDDAQPSVIIDVGAQILDVNSDVAAQWLRLRRDKRACIFFDDNDEKTVMTSDGSIEPWKSSPFKEQVEQCLLFLDEFHTRGTDFQLPNDFSAAVLLGPNLRKDTLVQACMRMRKLSFSQKLVFFGTPEVDDSIRTILKWDEYHRINTADIVEWSIYQTCRSRQQQLPLWVDRGLAFLQRRQAFDTYVNNSGHIRYRDAYLKAVLEDENHHVQKMYAESTTNSSGVRGLPYCIDTKQQIAKELLKHWNKCSPTGMMHGFKEQEQEREMLHEVEQEREVERPDAMNAQKVRINEELLSIIKSNRAVRARPESLRSAFDVLELSSLRRQYAKSQWPPYLLATDDFLNPVKIADGSDIDDFLRPVHWLLVLRGIPHIILISCHEANAYMEALRRSTVATLVLYSPLIHQNSGSFDSLRVYQVGAMPNIDGMDHQARSVLRLFAGQLYFNSFKEYSEFCLLLGLWDGKMILKGANYAGNYVPIKDRIGTHGWTGKWRSNPVELIRKFIAMRRQNEEWDHTHVGRVLDGQLLTEDDFKA